METSGYNLKLKMKVQALVGLAGLNEASDFDGVNNSDDVLRYLDALINYFVKKNESEKMKNESTNKPSERTIHGGVVFKNQLIVFGGGLNGNQPVDDQKVYIYNPSTDKWISLSIQGESPHQRHGHLMLNHQDEMIFVHGGMNLEQIYDDLWCINLKTFKWQQVTFDRNKPQPQARAAHGGVTINKNLYIFGGLSQSGQALDDLWKYNTG
jgi:N-acetylneuraminic acid mutarotase